MKKKTQKISLKKRRDSEAAQITLRTGSASEFWLLIVEALDSNIESIQEEMRSDDLQELPPDRYKLEMELLKAKEKYLKKLRDLPGILIQWFETPDATREDFDPFSKPEEM